MSDNDTMIAQFMAYRFDQDEDYQEGLASILSQNPLLDEDALLQTKIFYFNRLSGGDLTIAKVKQEQVRVLTFAELKDLLESGKEDQIPNNKVIPDKLNENPASESTAVVPKKPWQT